MKLMMFGCVSGNRSHNVDENESERQKSGAFSMGLEHFKET